MLAGHVMFTNEAILQASNGNFENQIFSHSRTQRYTNLIFACKREIAKCSVFHNKSHKISKLAKTFVRTAAMESVTSSSLELSRGAAGCIGWRVV